MSKSKKKLQKKASRVRLSQNGATTERSSSRRVAEVLQQLYVAPGEGRTFKDALGARRAAVANRGILDLLSK